MCFAMYPVLPQVLGPTRIIGDHERTLHSVSFVKLFYPKCSYWLIVLGAANDSFSAGMTTSMH